jgi:hypothetical protein
MFVTNAALLDRQSNYVTGVPYGMTHSEKPEDKEKMDDYKRQIEERQREV